MVRNAVRRLSWFAGLLVLACAPITVLGQTPRDARVIVTVVDPSGGVIPGATVSLLGLDPATRDTTIAPVRTTERGVATIERVRPGRYSIQAKFEGFDLGLVRDIQINTGDNRRAVVLPLKALQETVTIGVGQEAASERGNAAFGFKLTTDEIGALSDDPNELARQIAELGGSDAVIRVDSFEGQQLPPKAQIKSIHVTRDQFAAETEQPGSTFVDVITQAGVGALTGGANLSYRDGAMDGRNQFLRGDARTPGKYRTYGFNYGGPIQRERSDFSVSVSGNSQYRFPILNANAITGTASQVLSQRDTYDYVTINGLFNYALTRDQTLRVGYSQSNTSFATGVGGWDGPSRAYTGSNGTYGFRVMEAGPIGRRTFINSRVSVNWTTASQRAAEERQTIVVLDAMTTGGAQVRGGNDSKNVIVESDVDYVRGIHSWRGGVKVTGSRFSADQRRNYLGTYTFSSAADFLAGQPALFTIETGDPSIAYDNWQAAVYFQDDIRFGKSLTLSPGLRYSAQQRVRDLTAFEPRFGMTWSPTASGRTTIRASGGTFHGWLTTDIVAQTMRLDGTRQKQVIVHDPSFPDAGAEGLVVPPTKYVIGDYSLVQNIRYSAGVEQALTPRVRVSGLYTYWHMKQLPRGANLNPLEDGVRPDPAFGNVVATVTDGQIRRHDFNATFTMSLATPGPATNAPRLNWRRLTVNSNYAWLHPKRNADFGPFDVPPSGTLDTEWGPGPANIRYVWNTSITSTQLRNLSVNVVVTLIDGYVYTETTGHDDNGDGFLNDRRPGVGLWSLRTDGRETVNARIQYTIPIGATVAPAAQARHRIAVFGTINNITNHANYINYSGVITSPNYRKPTAVLNPRTINLGFNVNF